MFSKGDITKIIAENERRKAANTATYDQITGEGSDAIPRRHVYIHDFYIPEMWLPEEMLDKSELFRVLADLGSVEKLFIHTQQEDTKEARDEFAVLFLKERARYDFEFAAVWCLVIKNKIVADNTPFILNRGQRKLLKEMEDMRLAGEPIRIILLKARQWGGSTLVQLYFFWLQVFVSMGLSSVIAAHLQDASRNILDMYDLAAKNMPSAFGKLNLPPRLGMQNSKRVEGRNCHITVGSAEKPESVRSQSGHLAHFSEVAFYPVTQNNNPEKLITSIVSMVPDSPMTAIVLESTANGVGNYFYTEWKKSVAGDSAYRAVFVSWFEIDNMYSKDINDYEEFISSMSKYEWWLWDLGATLEAICWYRNKLKSQPSEKEQKQEFPSTPDEAFQTTGSPAFNRDHLRELEKGCIPPVFVGDIYSDVLVSEIKTNPNLISRVFDNIGFSENPSGLLKIWAKPDREEEYTGRYVVSVDTGGRSSGADYSVITVIDRYWMAFGEPCEVVAEWRGHIDHDMLVWIAAQIAFWYNKALLVFESNTHESEKEDDGNHAEFIFDILAKSYSNLYCRVPADKIKDGIPPKWGFHMNRSSKQMIIDNYTALIREGGYIERNVLAINEALIYEKKQNGRYGNIEGKGNHDDIVMSRMIGLYVAYNMPLPARVIPISIGREVVRTA